jgi:preprotein translocase subunit SecY
MWLGEMITEFGIGNGVSMIIFAGIVARIPSAFNEILANYSQAQIPTYLGSIVVALIVIAGVVFVTEAERPVPVTYAKQVRGNATRGGVSTYIPLRLNQAGVIPIIFALSLLVFPQMIATFLARTDLTIVANIANSVVEFLNNQLYYGIVYFVLVVLFTFFYTAVTFDPDNMAENLQKNGAFVPGVRPGVPTSEYVGNILTRITLFGALFLGVVAVLPLILKYFTGINALAIGGTGLLIAVSVVSDLIKKTEAQLTMREY